MRVLAAALLALLCTCASRGGTATSRPTRVHLVTIHRHNTSAFTEGLFFHGDSLIESTGLNGQSFIRQYGLPALPTATLARANTNTNNNGDASSNTIDMHATVQREFRFDAHMFGEGVASIGDSLFALTYKAKLVLELSLHNFTLLATHTIATTTGEGWGMTTDGTLLIVSDGSAIIQFVDPRTAFRLVRTITVHDSSSGAAITNVNELEFVHDTNEILANVWFTNHVLRINATDGAVLEVLDLAWLTNMVSNLQTPALLHSSLRHDAVMNGIALHPVTRHVFVTGKLWDSVFELELSYLRALRKTTTRQSDG